MLSNAVVILKNIEQYTLLDISQGGDNNQTLPCWQANFIERYRGQISHLSNVRNCADLGGADDEDTDGIDNITETDTLLTNPVKADTDDDGLTDGMDAYPLIHIASHTDTDLDGAPDNCDSECQALGMNADNDDDNDGMADINDAFPLDNTESLDTDSDGTGNNADTDDDGDGMPDEYETSYGLNSLVNDSDGDLDGDNLSNFFEYSNGSQPDAIEYSSKETDLLLSPLSYRFGVEDINDPACETNSQAVKYTIKNDGSETRNLGDISFSGTNADEFIIVN